MPAPAKEPRLWKRIPKQAGKRQVRQLSDVDGRTKLGRITNELRRELYDHLGGAPNAVERALVEQCVTLRAKTAMIDARIIDGTANEMETAHYIAWCNSLRRSLAALNFGEAAKLIRSTAESKLLREYSRKW